MRAGDRVAVARSDDIPDVCIVGAGLAGGLLADRLAADGVRVVVLEAGPRFSPEERWAALARAQRGERAWPGDAARDRFTSAGPLAYSLNDNRVKGVGGTTLHWTALTHRLHESDFRMRTLFGQGVDWPIAYADLEPWYAAAEAELEVAGVADNPFASPRSGGYPLPAFPFSYADERFARACDGLGIRLHHAPFARSSVAVGQRAMCQAFATCASHQVCPIGAQYSAEGHVARAERSGNATVLAETCVRRLETDDRGRVRAAVWQRADGSSGEQRARAFVLAAHAVETARLLLLSRAPSFPDGLANGSGAVGRYFTDHVMVYSGARLRRSMYPFRIGFHTAESQQFCSDARRAERGAFRLAFPNSAGPTPAALAAASGQWGAALAEEVREGFGREVGVHAFLDPIPDARNRVELDPEVTDGFGDPVPRLSYRMGELERRTREDAHDVMGRILDAAGAEKIWHSLDGEIGSCGHQIGTCRMGASARDSVVDRDLRAHEVDNLWIVGSAVFPTSGPLNPSLTIAALALRLADRMRAGSAA